MAQQFDWIVVKDYSGKDIGMVGFLGNDAVAIAAFYDGRDANKDGKVSWAEWGVAKVSPINLSGTAVAEVAMAGRADMRIYERDPSYQQMSANIYTSFAAGLVMDGVWAVYFKPGVSAIASGAAKRITSSMIKQMVIRKGFEKAAKTAFDRGVR